MDDMATFDPIGESVMTVTFSDDLGDSSVYGLVPVLTASNVNSGSAFITGGSWQYPNIYTPSQQDELEITHVVEEEEGLVGYAEDGTRVLLGDWVPTAVSLRVRSLLERIAGGEEVDESDLEKFVYLKRLLELQQEELETTANRIKFIEQLISL